MYQNHLLLAQLVFKIMMMNIYGDLSTSGTCRNRRMDWFSLSTMWELSNLKTDG